MPLRPTPRDLTAAVLVVVAGLIWTIWASRELRRPKPAPPAVAETPAAPKGSTPPAPPPPPVAPAPVAPDEARRLLAELRAQSADRRAALYARWRRGVVPDELIPELLAFIREALKKDQEDPEPLSLLSAIPGEKGGDALLEFAAPVWAKDVRLEALKLLGERGYSPAQIRKAALLFDAERDEDVQVSILLGTSKSGDPAAEELGKKGLHDPKETVRGVAMASLDSERDLDRRLLIGLATSDPSDHVRGSAALQLSDRSADPAVLDAILNVALKDASVDNRKLAVACLKKEAHRGEVRAVEALKWSAARDASQEVRAQAQLLLQGLPNPK